MKKKNELYDDLTKQLDYIFIEDPHKKLSNIIGEKYIEYRKNWVEAGKCKIVQDFPIHLNIALNDSCNLKCKCCILSVPINKRKFKPAIGKVSKEDFKKLLSEGVSYGLRSIEFGAINEPTISSDLHEYISIAKDCGIIDLMITTNANLLDTSMSEKLIKSGLTWIAFSVDAFTEETYNKIRIGGNFQKVMKNICNFLEIKKELNTITPITRMCFLKTKINYHELNDFIKYWINKVNVVSVQKLINTHYGYDDKDNFNSELSLISEDNPNTENCPSPFQRLVIRNNGDILPCCSFFAYDFKIGNIYERSLYEIWNSKEFKKLREKINSPIFSEKPEVCQLCIKGRIIKIK